MQPCQGLNPKIVTNGDIMYTTLSDAPFGKSLILKKIDDQALALQLKRMGLFEGSEITRIDEEVLIQPVRIKGPEKEVILGGRMGTKVIVHLDNGRKVPAAEMKPGETGHIEGLTCGSQLCRSLEVMGLKENDEITFLRKLPPMQYVAVIEKNKRISLSEGMAAKIWGKMNDKMLQFCSARAGENFYVQELLCGQNAKKMITSLGVKPGTVLILEGVEQAQSLFMYIHDPIIITSKDGLRLFLQQDQGKEIFVREI